MASRTGALRGRSYHWFWFGAFCIALMPTSVGYVGYQDFTVRSTRQPSAHRLIRHLIASPFGTIEPPTFDYGIHPIGTAMPQPPAVMLASYDTRSVDANAWSIDPVLRGEQATRPVYPTVNRRGKGDRLPMSKIAPAVAPQNLPQLQPINSVPEHAPGPAQSPERMPPTHAQAPAASPRIAHAKPAGAASVAPPVEQPAAEAAKTAPPPISGTAGDGAPRVDVAPASDLATEVPAAGAIGLPPGQASTLAAVAFADDLAEERSGATDSDANAMDAASGLQRWAPGTAPVMVSDADADEAGLKLSALDGVGDDGPGGETVADKGDVSRLQSPAVRLGLAGKQRARAEKCLTQAVYFEARGEPLRGQEAVAQVVMNRVFSGYYPNNVCDVVFQNASHYLACQFTFACEHKNLNRIDEPDMWAQAKRIAKDTLDGKIWLADIGHATHYHAYWVHPGWVHEMTRLYKLGVHTFYRPRAWGSGDYEPVWGSQADTPQVEPKAGGGAKGPQAEAASAPAAAVKDTTAKL